MDMSREAIRKQVDSAENNVVNIEELFTTAQHLLEENSERKAIHTFLDLGHLSSVNTIIADNDQTDAWLSLLIALIDKSKYSFGHLFYNRSLIYKYKHLFHKFNQKKIVSYTYEDIWEELIKAAGALTAIERSNNDNIRVGILTPNCLRGAIIDLTCLSFHFQVVPIPANATKNDIDFIINHSGITHLFIDNELKKELHYILNAQSKNLTLINLNKKEWQHFIAQGQHSDPLEVLKRIGRVQMDDIATIMYTSGTTGEPKGITFTQRNIIAKRFARALALTKLGSKDIFLAYLPLYHTFGRFLELQGSIFWGAAYAFAEDSLYDTLRKNFKSIKPSVFISVPKRWTQMYETIQTLAADHLDDDRIIRKAIKKVTGGKLKWGLSAAGFLDPDIFQFFQNNGVQLLSGYGMTEATGGITMTPEDDYVIDSVGKKLPGIKLKISDDGELLLNSSYISEHYYDEPLIPSTDDGWFHTGDIFVEKDGHYFIKDRKKEIYKNAAGQTLTPQKIENMLSEFDAIQSAFLIGDNMDFNTVLIYPDEEYLNLHIPDKEPKKIRSAISALVQSVNGFLAPFERIVNFAVIPRDFSTDHDELTQKGTFKRKNILTNWENAIIPMYAPNQANIESNGKVLSFPNWLLKEMNIVAQDISWSGRYLKIETLNRKCKCQWHDDTLILGEFEYTVSNNSLNLENILLDPSLWLGNSSLVIFFGDLFVQLIQYKKSCAVKLITRKSAQPILMDTFQPEFDQDASIEDLHTGTTLLIQAQQNGLEFFKHVFAQKDIELRKIGIEVLTGMLNDTELKFSRTIFNTLIPYLQEDRFISALKLLFERHQHDKKLRSFIIDESQLAVHHVEEIMKELINHRLHTALSSADQVYVRKLMNLAVSLGHLHPAQYAHIRNELTCWELLAANAALKQTAVNCNSTLTKHFKEMIGEVDIKSVDPKTGLEYSWLDILEIDKVIDQDEQSFLLNLFQTYPIAREAVFILSGYKLLHLEHIQKKGIWITPMNADLPIKQYRILINLQDGNAYNFILYHLPETTEDDIKQMSAWQIVKSTGLASTRITNDFLCLYPDPGIIVSAYETRANVESYLRLHEEELNNPKLRDRWDMRWLHFGWSGLQGYINHWSLTDFQFSTMNPAINNVIISEYDNAINVRINHSLFQDPVKSCLDFITTLYNKLITTTEKKFTGLNHVLNWEIVFTSILQAAGKEKGLAILNQIANEVENNDVSGLNQAHVLEYIAEVEAYGYIPKPVIFAALRFQRWMDLNPKATIEARCDILQELYNDYRLDTIYTLHPEVRLRYFLLTRFVDHQSFVAQRLFELSAQLHNHEITPSELESHIHALANGPQCTDEDSYFLARLIYQHIGAADYAELITRAAGQKKLDLAVNVSNKDGNVFTIRPPYKPKEIANFHDLLLAYDLPALFSEEHDFLIMFSANKTQVGGIFWKMIDEHTAHLEKIAIHKKYARSGLGDLLMKEMMQRFKKSGATHLTVGFMKTEFFQRFGFKADESFAGLVTEL